MVPEILPVGPVPVLLSSSPHAINAVISSAGTIKDKALLICAPYFHGKKPAGESGNRNLYHRADDVNSGADDKLGNTLSRMGEIRYCNVVPLLD
jgi:hypothetical protein